MRREACAKIAETAARAIPVADREADIDRHFAARPANVDMIVRARHDRATASGTALFAMPEPFDLMANPNEVRVAGGAPLRVAAEGGQIRLDPVDLLVAGGRDRIPLEGVLQGGLAHLDVVVDGGEDEVGDDPLELGRGTAGAVEFSDGDLERARVAGRVHRCINSIC